MAKKTKGLATSAGLYGVANVLHSLIPVFFVPILTRYLVPAEYGIIANFEVLVAFVMPMINSGLSSAIMRHYYEQDTIDLSSYISNCMLILAGTFLLLLLILLLGADILYSVSKFPVNMVWMIAAVGLSQTLIRILLALWRAEKKPVHFGIYKIFETAVNFGLSVYFVVVLDWGWQGRVYGIFWAFVIFGSIALFILFLKGYLRLSFNKEYVLNALRYGLPLIPHGVSGVVRTMTDRLFITTMVGVDATGLYSVGYQVGKVIGFLENTFNMAWVPWFFEQLKKDDPTVKRKIVRYTYLYMLVIGTLALLFSLAAPAILRVVVGKKFHGATVFIVWIAMGYAFNGMYKMVCNYFFYTKKTHLLSLVTTITAAANIGLNYVMISRSGAIGAAQATTITLLLSFVMTWVMAARTYKMPWSLKKKYNGIDREDL